MSQKFRFLGISWQRSVNASGGHAQALREVKLVTPLITGLGGGLHGTRHNLKQLTRPDCIVVWGERNWCLLVLI